MKRIRIKFLQVDLKHDESIGVAFVFWIQGPCRTVNMIDVVTFQQLPIHIYSHIFTSLGVSIAAHFERICARRRFDIREDRSMQASR